MSERRRSQRKERVLNIQYRLKRSSNGSNDRSWHLGVTHDMSAHGISFVSDTTGSPGDVLELQVIFSGILDVVKAEGRVIRVSEKVPGKQYLIAVELEKHLD